MDVRRLPGLQAGLGLLAGLILFFAAGLWFVGGAVKSVYQETEFRKATVGAMSLANLVGSLQESQMPAEVVAAAVQQWRGGDPAVRHVRLIQQAGAQLVYSDVAADSQAGALPRRLVRDEKPLFDLAGQLRASVDSNRAEGIKRLPEIDISSGGSGLLVVAAPVYVGETYWGFAQIQREISVPSVSGDTGLAMSFGIGALVLLVVAITVAVRAFSVTDQALDDDDDGKVGRWVFFVAGLVILFLASHFYGREELHRVGETQHGLAQQLDTVYTGLLGSAQSAAAQAGVTLPSGVTLDVDQFRRPTGQIGADGRVDSVAVTVAINDRLGSLQTQLWVTAGLSALLLAAFALGGMRRLWNTMVEHWEAYTYVMPAILGMLVLVFFPFTYGVILAFTDRTLFNQSVPLTELWVGLDNFIKILGDVNVLRWTPEGWVVNYESFYWTLFITICWTVSNVAIGVTLGLVLALALNVEGLRGKAIYRVLLILPWAIPNYITALTWKGMFHPQFGVINQVIVMFGGEPVFWFDSVFSSFMTGVITNGWLSFPFMMVVSLGALQSIPTDMYEAAELDGATKWQQFWNITLPLLKPALIPAIILSIVWTFNMFNVIYLVSGGSPAGANEILITKAYKIAFERYQYAYAAAYSFVIFLILLGYGVFQNRVSKATEQVR